MTDYSKRIKRLQRELAAEAYEKEPSRELSKLEKSFEESQDGKINSKGVGSVLGNLPSNQHHLVPLTCG